MNLGSSSAAVTIWLTVLLIPGFGGSRYLRAGGSRAVVSVAWPVQLNQSAKKKGRTIRWSTKKPSRCLMF
jgi:hypothetical protein